MRKMQALVVAFAEVRTAAVTFAKVARGCAVCDESRVDELRVEDAG